MQEDLKNDDEGGLHGTHSCNSKISFRLDVVSIAIALSMVKVVGTVVRKVQ